MDVVQLLAFEVRGLALGGTAATAVPKRFFLDRTEMPVLFPHRVDQLSRRKFVHVFFFGCAAPVVSISSKLDSVTIRQFGELFAIVPQGPPHIIRVEVTSGNTMDSHSIVKVNPLDAFS